MNKNIFLGGVTAFIIAGIILSCIKYFTHTISLTFIIIVFAIGMIFEVLYLNQGTKDLGEVIIAEARKHEYIIIGGKRIKNEEYKK